MTPCPVHPYATGGEIKTIGLFLRPGESHASRYAAWAMGCGVKCVCAAPPVADDWPTTDGPCRRAENVS